MIHVIKYYNIKNGNHGPFLAFRKFTFIWYTLAKLGNVKGVHFNALLLLFEVILVHLSLISLLSYKIAQL